MAAINLGQLFELVPKEVTALPVPAAQPMDRDLAVSVAESTPLGEVMRVLRSSAGPNLSDARVFDIYRGEQVGEGRVSYAIALRFQPESAGDEKGVERAMSRVRGALQHHLGAQIR
jgi:phenylalanyl-tRNA synthetase beta chain